MSETPMTAIALIALFTLMGAWGIWECYFLLTAILAELRRRQHILKQKLADKIRALSPLPFDKLLAERVAPSRILTVSLYRSLERLSIAIEGCGKIGFEESKPTTNEQHGQIWLELNDAQRDAKLKLKHYALALFDQPVVPKETK